MARYAPSHFARLSPDSQARHLVSLVTAAEWEARVAAVDFLPVRRQLACIIWWDYLTRHDIRRPAPLVERLVSEWKPGDADFHEEVHRYLLAWGYPAKHARVRAYPVNDKDVYHPSRKPRAAA